MISLSSTKRILCLFVILLSFSNAKLVIKSPDDLSRQFSATGLEYTILTPQNKITYKRIFIGSLKLPPQDQRDACNALPSLSNLKEDAVYNPVLLTTWGDCHYAQKVKNAEIAGAKMVILILRHDLEANHALVRQLPISTSVEVLCISATDGQILLDYLDNANNQGKSVEITYSYEVEKHVNYQGGSDVTLDFWYSSGDLSKASYNFLDTINEILQNFDQHVKFNPRYVVWNYDGSSKDDPKCLKNGKYCDPDRFNNDRISGKETVLEDLRQICLKEQTTTFDLNSEWWKYVSAFGEQCIDKAASELNDCRETIFQELSPNTKRGVQQCIDNSLVSDENKYLQREVDDRDKMSVDHYPSFYVNKERYTGSFRNKYTIKEFICSHFVQDHIPETCIATVSPGQPVTSSSDTLLYILIVILSVLIMALMLYCVRRSVKRQVMTRMNDEISHIVTQYKQFKDKSNSFSADEEM